MKYRNAFINSTAAFVIGAILETTLHECGHFFCAMVFHGNPTLFHNYVRYPDLQGEREKIITALAGPVTSLVVGLSFHLLLKKRNVRGFSRILFYYLGIFGYSGFFGYLMIAPIFGYGDTGYALRELHWSMPALIAASVVAIIIMLLLSIALSKQINSLMSNDTLQHPKARGSFGMSVIIMPLVIGVSLTTLLNLPVPTPLSLIAPLASPMVILWPTYYYFKGRAAFSDEDETINKSVSSVVIIFLLAIVLLNRILVKGVQ